MAKLLFDQVIKVSELKGTVEQSNRYPAIHGLEFNFLLRWELCYANKKTKSGQWFGDSDNLEDKASYQSREGLLFARISGKDVYSRNFRTMAEVRAEDFCFFQWEVLAAFGAKDFRGLSQSLVGLRLVCRDVDVLVLCDGSVKIFERSEEEKNYHYKVYGS